MNLTILSNINAAASIALEQATAAANQSTFAVGGLMINNMTGEVIHAIHNNVIMPLRNNSPFTFDPTAHGERQLVYWYYQNKERLNLPDPSQITVITSLDPCAMCAGALLTAGFNIGVIAIDTCAGINYAQDFKFNTLPPNLRALAQTSFGYYASGPSQPPTLTRPYVGSSNVAFCNEILTPANLMNCGAIFNQSVNAVRSTSNTAGFEPSQMQDPACLPESSPIIAAYRKLYSRAFTIKVDNPRLPDQKIFDELRRVLNAASNACNAVAFIDPFGNLVLCMADAFEISPVHTSFMNVTQAYASTRWNLTNDYVSGTGTDDPNAYLTHPKYGTFIFLFAPDPCNPTTIMTLGAYGSTMEGEIPNMFPANLQFYYPPCEGGSFSQLASVISGLPPFYTQSVNISIMQVPEFVSNQNEELQH